MAYIWHTNIDGHVELHEDAIHLIPELAYLEPGELKFIILYSDYRRSPIKGFPEIQREKIAKLKSGFKEEDNLLDKEYIKMGIKEFTSLIYDERRERRRILQMKLELQNRKIEALDMTSEKEIKEAINISKYIEQEIQRIDKSLATEDDDADLEIKGDKRLSYIERWQLRRKKYLTMIEKNG